MLRKLLILFFGLILPLASLADKGAKLYLEPKPNAKIIGAIKNTQAMVLLEQQGKWAKVIDGDTGRVGWTLAKSNTSSNVPDNTSTR